MNRRHGDLTREAKAVLRPWWHRIRPRVQVTLGIGEQRERLDRLEAEVAGLRSRIAELDILLQHADLLLPPAGSDELQSLVGAPPAHGRHPEGRR
jgi:hypothetical protein